MLWHARHARSMPWRTEPRDPYAVWISEVMLQQTRVASVAPYFERFMRRFPNVKALAAASLDEVLSLWSGLGYYRRARALHAAAQKIDVDLGGRIPSSIAALLTLPGIGSYTASAIASLAYGEPAAVVDGNVCRVVARLFALRTPIDEKQTRAEIEHHAAGMLDRSAPGAFNEAMMDLGAVVCTPRSPACAACPVAACCGALRSSEQETIPVMPRRRAVPRVELVALVAECDGHVLLGQRSPSGLFGGMWEPLTWEGDRSVARRSKAACAIGAERWRACGTVEHTLTHRMLVVRVFAASARHMKTLAEDQLPAGYDSAGWYTAEQARARGLSVLARKVMACAGVGTD